MQGAWADWSVWSGYNSSQPRYYSNYGGRSNVYVLRDARELAYVTWYWGDYFDKNLYLDGDMDMTAASWQRMGDQNYTGTFYGNNHTIRIKISEVTENYQGLFYRVGSGGRVQDLHVDADIRCLRSRLVGGIAGENDGTIENCWVSGIVLSNWQESLSSYTAKVGGICGQNDGTVAFCCVTANVQNHDADVGGIVGYNSGGCTINHCTFYGEVSSVHSQDNEYVGDQNGNLWNQHSYDDLSNDAILRNYLNSFSGYDLYRYAVQYPHTVNVSNNGYGALEATAPGARPGKPVTLRKAYGSSVESITVQDPWGRNLPVSGNANSGYTFTMPRCDVTVSVRFSGNSLLSAHKGSASDPYTIGSSDDWNAFAYYVNHGNNFSGKYVKLTKDITISKTVGLGKESIFSERPFSGTFDGDGHTLTANLSSTASGTSWNEEGVAPFHFITNATIKNLKVAGTISSASYHTAGIAGFAYGNNLIEGCTITATLNISNNYAGGIVGHGESSATTIRNCVFAGTVNGIGQPRINVGGFWGWSTIGRPMLVNCIEKGTYNNIASMHPMGLQGGTGSITDCYYLNAAYGSPTNGCSVSGAWQVSATAPQTDVCGTVTAADGKAYYLACEVSGLKEKYFATGSAIEPDVVVTWKGNTLTENVDYVVSYANNVEPGTGTVTIRGKGNYSGEKSMTFTIVKTNTIDVWWSIWVVDYNFKDGDIYQTKGNVELDWGRLNIDGNVVLILGEGSTLTCEYGIEVNEGSTLTIEGPGTLNIDMKNLANDKSAIGANKMGTVIINGGTINVTGAGYGAGIGGDLNNASGGKVIINGGVVNARGGYGAAGIGGGYSKWEGNYGVCGDVIINGGQVTAQGGQDAPFSIGGGGYSGVGGSIKLGWTNLDDFINVSRVNEQITTFGKQFVIDGTQTIATANNMRGKKIVPYMTVASLPGNGTSGDPYTISSAADWDLFARNITYGNSYSGKYVKLTQDISVTQKCGYVSGNNPAKAFSGTFDGGGKTITATLSDKNNQGTALFSYINGATIKNLTVAGTISSKKNHTSGLVGFAAGTNTIEGCTVTATLNIKSDYAGGIVGHGLASSTTIRNCVFAGTVNGTDGKHGNIGGIWGWSDSGNPVLVNCLEKGTYNNISSMHPMGLQNGEGTITTCYYLNPTFGSPARACTVSGAYQVSNSAFAGEISRQQRLVDGNNYYIPCIIGGIDEYYELSDNGTVRITPTVTLPDGTKQNLGTDYTATLDGHAVTSFPINITTKGTFTLAFTGKGACTGSKSVEFNTITPIAGDGTEGNPYLIRNTEEWNLLATLVSKGNNFSGAFVKLNTDISVTTMVGVRDDKPFSGTFDGGGKTITASITDNDNQGTAPFRFISGATIKNLNVAGTIASNKYHTAGLVGFAEGTNTIEGCTVTATLNITSDYAGGIIGHGLISRTTIKECIFNGTINGTGGNRRNIGGIWGWSDSATPVLVNCLEIGTYNNIESMHPVGLQKAAGSISGCYYVTPQIGSPSNACTLAGAKQVYTTAPDGELCLQARLADGNMYYLPCTVSGISESYVLNGEIRITPTVTGIEGEEQQPKLGTDYTATLNGNAVTSFPFSINAKGDYTLTLTGKSENYTGSKSITFIVNGALAGAGTAESPYLVSSNADWVVIADNIVNDSLNYRDKFVKLTADIAVTRMLGVNSARSFQGTFDGDGHTLTFTTGSSSEPFAEEYCAPFRYVSSATIKNLHVAGDIYTSKKFAGGLVGQPGGTTTITNCRVSTFIHSSINGDGTHGGIVAMPSGVLTITDCIYDGRLLTSNGTTDCGGFVGWHNGQTISITSSLYAPDTSIATGQGEGAINNGATFVRGASTGNYCYYTEPMGQAQGRQVYATLPDGELCIQAQAADGKMYYLPCTVGGVEASYMLEAGISITPTVTGLDGEEAQPVFGTDYTATLNGEKVESFPVSPTAKGDYTLTLTGISDNYTGSKNVKFSVIASLNGEGTETNPYIVSDNADWMQLASKVAEGLNLSGQYVKLTNDIEITTTMGVREDKPFSGIFLGNGHTLTANISNTNSADGGQAPFHFIKDATIKNLTVAGIIASNSRHTAGLVGFAEGTNLIEGCTVSATLNVSSDYAGGIVGHGLTSSTTIRDCIFDGTINGVDGNRPNMGGLWGWSDSGTPVLVNCLEKGTYRNISSMHPMGLQHNAGSITGCYYVNPMIGSPDHACTVSGACLVKASVPANDVYKPVTAADANTYFMPCTVSGVCKAYQYTGSDIAIIPPTVTAGDGTVLKEGTDYTYAVSPAIVKEKGDYAMTFSGQGSYEGTSTIAFAVSDEISVTEESTVLTGNCMVYNDVTIAERITVRGNVVLNLCEGVTLTAKKGFELSKGNTLTINGPGALIIDDPDAGKSGIGAVEVGTLIINGGKITVKGGEQAAGFGGDKNNTSGGSITINGGVVEVAGDVFGRASGIGGGNDDQVGHYGVCGDVVINGGQVRAMGLVTSIGQGFQKPGADETTYTSGTLTLGWTNLDDYFHDCSILGVFSGKMGVNSVTFVEGKQFVYDGETKIAKPDSIGGRTIRPYFTLPGEGTEDKPYTIDSVEVWNDFAHYVNYGYSFSGKHVKLTTDISVETMCGTVSGDVPGNAFSGIFDGDSHTITATITDTDNQGTALFRYINGATIKNVLVAGNINGGMHAAAIVGFANGTGNILTNCAATANVSGGSHIGGLLGNALDADMAITGCVYAGMMTGGDTAKGAILGWGDDVAFGSVPARSVTDCLYIMLDGQNTENLDLVKGHGSVTVTNCYKTTMAEYEAQNGQNARVGAGPVPARSAGPISPISPSAPLNDEEDDYDITDLESYGIWANVYDTMPDYFGDLLMDYGFLKVYEGGLEYDGYYIVACISLAANADNSDLISLATDYIVDATLTDRTFRKDGSWQTLCLPFDVALEGSPLEGAKVMTLGNSEACQTGFDAATGTLTLEFVEADKIEAGIAYIVKWENTEDTALKNPMFRGVTVTDEAPQAHATTSSDGYVQFVGTYSPVDIYTADKTNLYLDADGMLCCPWGEGMTAYNVNACTAYFQLLNGLTAGDAATDIRAVRLIFGAEDPVGIKEIEDGRWKIEDEAGAWFTLDGRKIVNSKSSNRKLNRGVYINNGKKVVK